MGSFRSDLFAWTRAEAGLPPSHGPQDPGLIPEWLALCGDVRARPEDPVLLHEAARRFRELGTPWYAIDCRIQLERIGAAGPADLLDLGTMLAGLGDRSAEAVLQRAADRDDLAMSAIGLLLDAGYSRTSLKILLGKRRSLDWDQPAIVATLAAALDQQGRRAMALKVGQHWFAREPNAASAKFVASQLGASGQHKEALALLTSRNDLDGQSLFLAAQLAQVLRRADEALHYIDAALAAGQSDATLHAVRASILAGDHRMAEAAAEVSTALGLGAPTEYVRRTAFAIYTEANLNDQAMTVGAGLVAEFPDDPALSSCLRTVIDRKDRETFRRDIARRQRATSAPQPARLSADARRATAESALSRQMKILIALFLREMRTRFGRSRYGYFWVVFEPLAHIGIMISLITLLSHSRMPPIGPNFALFYFTGIIPYHLFTHTVSHCMKSAAENKPLLQLPPVNILDVFLARGVLELVTEMIVSLVILMGFAYFGLFQTPLNIIGVVMALGTIWIAGLGLGMIFSIISSYFSGTERVWGAISSLIYFTSGTFYVPRMMPEWIRDILAWSPVLQAIEWVRYSYFFTPTPGWLDIGYMLGTALVALCLGLVGLKTFARRLLGTE